MPLSRMRRAAIEKQLAAYPYYRHLKMDWVWFDGQDNREGEACLIMPFDRESLANLEGKLHGGATASLIDTANNLALLAISEEDDRLYVIQLNINYLAPVEQGYALALARTKRNGHATVCCEAEVFNIKRKRPGRAKSPQEYQRLLAQIKGTEPVAKSLGSYRIKRWGQTKQP